ncbi:YkvA family protein [Aquamicrobium ahrensii]|uniref:Uncharacterized membrane protein YkvA (DUF1232 family) n=1 Tax=Aquamicrobium ahrensii TaxID=469551 RepID=A0ABV2KFC0_9HYPH
MILDLLKRRFLLFRREAVMLWYAFRDRRTPFYLKAASLFAGLYLLSPIDLIPFPVPVLGVIDDLVIVPLLVGFIAKRLPQDVRNTAGGKADNWLKRWFRRPLIAVVVILALLVVVWVALLYLIYRYLAG